MSGLSLIFEVGGDTQKTAGDSSCCSEVNMLVLYQSSRGYTSKYEGKIPCPRPLMTALPCPHLTLKGCMCIILSMALYFRNVDQVVLRTKLLKIEY